MGITEIKEAHNVLLVQDSISLSSAHFNAMVLRECYRVSKKEDREDG